MCFFRSENNTPTAICLEKYKHNGVWQGHLLCADVNIFLHTCLTTALDIRPRTTEESTTMEETTTIEDTTAKTIDLTTPEGRGDSYDSFDFQEAPDYSSQSETVSVICDVRNESASGRFDD